MSSTLEPDSRKKLPVLVCAFARRDSLKQILAEVIKYEPTALYIHLDGPDGRLKTEEQHSDLLNLLGTYSAVEWPVHFRVRKNNLGCSAAMITAIDWFFSRESAGIILEDDCIPSPEFFVLCEAFLSNYELATSVWGVSGDNSARVRWPTSAEINFTRYPLVWGWASWRNRWVDFRNEKCEAPGHGAKKNFFFRHSERLVFRDFRDVRQPRVDSWDYLLAHHVVARNGSWGLPQVNLVSNVGFDEFATHTKIRNSRSDVPIARLRRSYLSRRRIRVHRSALVDVQVLFKVHGLLGLLVQFIKQLVSSRRRLAKN